MDLDERNNMAYDMLQQDHIEKCKRLDPRDVIDTMDYEIAKFNELLETIVKELDEYGHDYSKEEALTLIKEEYLG